jgi:hypothetical protein
MVEVIYSDKLSDLLHNIINKVFIIQILSLECNSNMINLVLRVAYTAKTRECLLNGLESFLHELTVLPPGKWDPAIRLL